MNRLKVILIVAVVLLNGSLEASFHLFQITEVFSNADGSVQFIELTAQQREQIVNLVRTFAYLSDDEEPKGNS